MLMPRIFGNNVFDSFFDFPFDGYSTGRTGLMEMDVKDTEKGYEIILNMPGVKKENVKAELKDGYLTIQASSDSENGTKDESGHYIRRERYSGSCSRSFYVGEEVTQEEIKAKFEDGTLKLFVPKKEEKAPVEQKHYIAIEG